MRIQRAMFACSSSLLVLAAPHAALAQDQGEAADPAVTQAVAPPPAQSNSLEDIVVTAQKRSENLQRVPIAATAVTGETLAQAGVSDLKDITKLSPNLTLSTTYGNTSPQITIRGVGSTSFNQTTETTVALYLDEFVLNSPFAKLGQLYDLERLEILRGPQGTLYGKNSTGGAINFISRKPDGTYGLNGMVTVARFGEYSVELGGQAPLSDTLSIRVAAKRRYRDGYGFNTFTKKTPNDINDWAGRLLLRYQDGSLDATLKVFGDKSSQQAYYMVTGAIETPGMPFPGRPIPSNINPITGFQPSPEIDIHEAAPSRSDVAARGVTFNASLDLGSLTLTSVTGYLYSKSDIVADIDGSPFPLAETDPYYAAAKQFAQEIRLSSPASNRFSWILGASYFYHKTNYKNNNVFTVFGLPSVAWEGEDEQNSIAAFFDGTFRVSEQLSIVGGIRLTKDSKDYAERSVTVSLIGPYDVRDSKSWTEPTYRLGVNFQLDPRTLLYASYNHGYRSGAYDSGLKTATIQFSPANPEFVDNYEAGLKTTLLNNRLRISTAFFYQILKDQQNIVSNSQGICCAVINAGKAKIYGWEVEGVARFADNFDLNFSGAVTRSRYLEFVANGVDYSGASLQNVPRYQIRIAPEYRVPYGSGEFFIAPEIVFTGRSRLNSLPDPYGLDEQEPYQLVNGQIGYRTDDFSIFAFVKNATNKRYRTFFTAVSVYGFTDSVYNDPRIYGVTGTFRF